MNHSFYEGRSKEKVKQLLEEGQRSQAFYRSGVSKNGFFRNPQKLMLLILGILGLLGFLIR